MGHQVRKVFFFMKYNPSVSSSRKKNRKTHYGASSSERRKTMKSPLIMELKTKFGVNAVQVHKNDTVRVVRGIFKGRTGKITAVLGNRRVVNIEGVKIEKTNGQTIAFGINPSKCIIIGLDMNERRKLKFKKS